MGGAAHRRAQTGTARRRSSRWYPSSPGVASRRCCESPMSNRSTGTACGLRSTMAWCAMSTARSCFTALSASHFAISTTFAGPTSTKMRGRWCGPTAWTPPPSFSTAITNQRRSNAGKDDQPARSSAKSRGLPRAGISQTHRFAFWRVRPRRECGRPSRPGRGIGPPSQLWASCCQPCRAAVPRVSQGAEGVISARSLLAHFLPASWPRGRLRLTTHLPSRQLHGQGTPEGRRRALGLRRWNRLSAASVACGCGVVGSLEGPAWPIVPLDWPPFGGHGWS